MDDGIFDILAKAVSTLPAIFFCYILRYAFIECAIIFLKGFHICQPFFYYYTELESSYMWSNSIDSVRGSIMGRKSKKCNKCKCCHRPGEESYVPLKQKNKIK